MQSIKWSKAHATCVPEIDADHRTIFELAQNLQQAIRARAPAPQVHAILKDLMAHVEAHFEYEERLMRSVRYPLFPWHKRQHDTMRKRAGEFVPRIQNGDEDAEDLWLDFLAGWLRDHTRLADRMMGAYVRNQRLVRAVA